MRMMTSAMLTPMNPQRKRVRERSAACWLAEAMTGRMLEISIMRSWLLKNCASSIVCWIYLAALLLLLASFLKM
ncbi:Uncharacterised protein [Segatella copri]|nr:Uncharacterised protein [Segatella copri]